MAKTKIGFALTGSFCTFKRVLDVVEDLVKLGFDVLPILSYASSASDTRFMKAEFLKSELMRVTGHAPLDTLQQVEPIGPKKMVDALVIAPCTGNSLAKLAHGIADTPVLLAAKSTLRNANPVVIGVSTNDGLAAAAQNIGILLARKNIYFVPFGQDDHIAKPASIVAHMEKVAQTLEAALQGKQVQPVLE
ncbi:MAG: dipicolinate synthase subunit B [Oscillospiraceae bacterium]|jgi:dipicolinate synthase subunit B|nr:dipicolinate synthase subunit B [Oscillospiraceae bacterium]